MPTYAELLLERAHLYDNRTQNHGTHLLDMARVDDSGDNEIMMFNLVDLNSLASCHPVAEFLQDLLGTGDPAVGTGAFGVSIARGAVLRKQSIIHVQYARKNNRSDGHSFSLLSTPDGVESLEAWAGEEGYQLHQCLEDDLDQLRMTHDEVWTALGKLVSPARATREAAFTLLSRAENLEAFSDNEDTPREDMELTITSRTLRSLEAARGAIDQRLQATYTWYARVLPLLA